MVRGVSVVSRSGLVLFSSPLGSGLPPAPGADRLLGALLATVARQAEGAAGGLGLGSSSGGAAACLRLVEFDGAAVYMAPPPAGGGGAPVGVTVTLSGGLRPDEALAFGSALAGRLLGAFLDDYAGELLGEGGGAGGDTGGGGGAHALGAFREFRLRLPGVLRDTARGVLAGRE